MTDEVAKTSAAYDRMATRWHLPRTLMGGTRAMRAAGETYLPKEPKESKDAYGNRLARSTLFNAFKRTVKGIVGKVFARDPVLSEGTPESIKDWSEDIDMMGRNLATFASDVFENGVEVGLSHILVDMPSGDPGKTVAEEKARNRRPYFVHIKAEDLISWKTATINGKEVLTQIRFRENVTVDDGEYGEKAEERVRVLWRDRYEIWKKVENKSSKDTSWELLENGTVSLGEIPLATFYAARTGFMLAEPPLEDLAFLNVAHWQSASDQRHILHVARVPLLFGRALTLVDENGEKLEIGPNRMITSEDPQGDLKYVEHGGAAISAGRQDLLDIEDRMRVMGLEIFLPKQQTAAEKKIDSDDANSQAKAMALALQDALELAFSFMAKWVNKTESGSVVVNTDFLAMFGQNAQEVGTLLNARMAGEISRETFWAEMKRRGFLMDDFDAVAEEERLAADAGGIGGIGTGDA